MLDELTADQRTRVLQSVKARIARRNGYVGVEDSVEFHRRSLRCSCPVPCGNRAFPGVRYARELKHSDIASFMKRVWHPAVIEGFFMHVREKQAEARAMRSAGVLTKSGFVLLQRLPGPLARALAHDFPDEFSPTEGAYSKEAAKNLEKIFPEVCINRQWTRRSGEG